LDSQDAGPALGLGLKRKRNRSAHFVSWPEIDAAPQAPRYEAINGQIANWSREAKRTPGEEHDTGSDMTQRAGQCRNYELCGTAQRHETVLADELAFVCPECKEPLYPAAPDPHGWRPWMLGLLGAVAAAGLAGVGWLAFGPSAPAPAADRGPVAPTTASAAGPASSGNVPAPTPLVPIGCTPAPLLMPGKRTLYQRILVRPDAKLAANPGDSEGKPLPPLLTYYVYQRKPASDESWVKVGATPDCRTDGWIREERTVPWKQQIVVTFDNPAGRGRVLLFKDVDELRRIAALPKPSSELAALEASLRGGASDRRIVAAEPENYVDFTRHFYLLPILGFEDAATASGLPLHLLKIHSIAEPSSGNAVAPRPKAAVVFVIDSTRSMKPYIDRTKKAVHQIFQQLSLMPHGNEIRFGLVAFRSSTQAVPGLQYVAKKFVDPNGANNAADFTAGIAKVEEARVSTARFDEDAYAGVMLALKDIDWTPYLGRYIVLITDAGALDANDPLSQTGKGASEVSAAARDRDVLPYAIHLKTPLGRKLGDHPKAEQQYRELTKSVLTGDALYYPVENAGAVADFGKMIDCAARSMISNIRSVGERHGSSDASLAQYCPPATESMRKMREDAELIGLALRLKYLGLTPAGQTAPKDFAGWISDRDLDHPARPSVEVRVLLTKNQLSNLSNGVRVILEAAKSGRTSAAQFYRSLLDFASRMGRDPMLAKPSENVTIADLGILGEYLDDLPYKSATMSLDQDTWENWSASQQDEFIHSIENKLERYRDYESDCTLWTDLANPQPRPNGGCSPASGDSGEMVYPVPIDALP
jgi:serine/threonine-protein kinase PpkA